MINYIDLEKLNYIKDTNLFKIYHSHQSLFPNSFHDLFTIETGTSFSPIALLSTLKMPLHDNLNPCFLFSHGEIKSNFFAYQDGFIHARNILQDNFSNETFKDLIVFDHGFDQPPFPGGSFKFFKNLNGEFIFEPSFLESHTSYNFNGFSGDWDNDGFPELFICNLSKDSPLFFANDYGGKLIPKKSRLPEVINQNMFQALSGSKFKGRDRKLHIALGSAGIEQRIESDLILLNSGDGYFKNKNICSLPPRRGGNNWAAIEMHDFNSYHLIANYHDSLTQNGIIDIYIQNDRSQFDYYNPNKPLYEEKDCWFPRMLVSGNEIIAIKGRGLNNYISKELNIVLLINKNGDYHDFSEELLPLGGKEFIGILEIKNKNKSSDIIFMEHSGDFFYCKRI